MRSQTLALLGGRIERRDFNRAARAPHRGERECISELPNPPRTGGSHSKPHVATAA